VAFGKQPLASGHDNHSILIVREENRSENDGKSRAVQYYEHHSDFQLLAVLVQQSALFMGKLMSYRNTDNILNIQLDCFISKVL
jgi:hypothetical protein